VAVRQKKEGGRAYNVLTCPMNAVITIWTMWHIPRGSLRCHVVFSMTKQALVVAIVVGVCACMCQGGCEQLMTVVGGGSHRQCRESGRGSLHGQHGTLWPCGSVVADPPACEVAVDVWA